MSSAPAVPVALSEVGPSWVGKSVRLYAKIADVSLTHPFITVCDPTAHSTSLLPVCTQHISTHEGLHRGSTFFFFGDLRSTEDRGIVLDARIAVAAEAVDHNVYVQSMHVMRSFLADPSCRP
eukprot:ANDGO_03966.mRNA.1 hypothetical protein